MLRQLKTLLQDHTRRRAERIAKQPWNAYESQHLEILVSPAGLEVRGTSNRKIVNTPRSVRWQDISRVYVFKRDRMTVDDICMVFEGDGCVLLEINEEMKGWQTLGVALPLYLDGTMNAETWFAKVVRPAFAPSTTIIFDARIQQEVGS